MEAYQVQVLLHKDRGQQIIIPERLMLPNFHWLWAGKKRSKNSLMRFSVHILLSKVCCWNEISWPTFIAFKKQLLNVFGMLYMCGVSCSLVWWTLLGRQIGCNANWVWVRGHWSQTPPGVHKDANATFNQINGINMNRWTGDYKIKATVVIIFVYDVMDMALLTVINLTNINHHKHRHYCIQY